MNDYELREEVKKQTKLLSEILKELRTLNKNFTEGNATVNVWGSVSVEEVL